MPDRPEPEPAAPTAPAEPGAGISEAVDQLVRLCAADSTSGCEEPAVLVAEALAAELGLASERLPAGPGRDNLLVGAPHPTVVLCTHLDTVPPFLPPRRDGDVLWGRGTCDAKGAAIAMLHGLARARALGAGQASAVLLVVGEETDHLGAKAVVAAHLRGERPFAPRHVVLGEPCGMRPAAGQKGLLKLHLATRGTAAHSAYPELGASAIHVLLDALERLRKAALPEEPRLGRTTLNIGEIKGGLAPNVIAPTAEASVLIRCAAPVAAVLEVVLHALGPSVSATELGRAEPIDFATLDEATGPAVPFNTDAGHLGPLGAELALMGPGDMRHAHGPSEHLRIADLDEGIRRFAEVLTRLDPAPA